MLVHRKVTPSSKFASTHFYTLGGERHNAVASSVLELGPPDPGVLTIRLPHLPHCVLCDCFIQGAALKYFPATFVDLMQVFDFKELRFVYLHHCLCILITHVKSDSVVLMHKCALISAKL